MSRFVVWLAACAMLACGPASSSIKKGASSQLDADEPWVDPETDLPAPKPRFLTEPPPAPAPLVIRGATILTATGQRFERGTLVLADGKIAYVGADAPASLPADARIIDGTDRFVTPGIIDAHSHIGVYPTPHVASHSDGNEMTSPVTAEARAEYAYWPQDPSIPRAVAGGVTAALVLPGSANLIGGRGFTVEMRPGRTVDEVAFPHAPPTLKMACGENPKGIYGKKGGPQTRMGEYAEFRAAFQRAAEYRATQKDYARKRAKWLRKRARAAELDAEHATRGHAKRTRVSTAPKPPARDAGLATLAAVLDGEILVQVHCYKASEIREMIAIANEFGFAIRSFHHALGAYKVRDLIVEHGAGIATWADWWGFKMEAFDGIPENAALFSEAGGRAVIHSDSASTIQRLNQEAAKAMYAGRAAGIEISDDEALRWVTANPAWVLGIDAITGTLEVGKRADVVLWSAHPFSVYARADGVWSGGELLYERERGMRPTDFELGQSAATNGGAR